MFNSYLPKQTARPSTDAECYKLSRAKMNTMLSYRHKAHASHVLQVIFRLRLKTSDLRHTAELHNFNHNNRTCTYMYVSREPQSTLQKRVSSSVNVLGTIKCILLVLKINWKYVESIY